MTDDAGAQRHLTLDALRGIAVMGILLMNIVNFAMPSQAYVNPLAWGGEDRADIAIWLVNFVLVDGKMRGLFSLLFGASTMLVIERAEAREASPIRAHYARMAWLMLFGLAHYYLIWTGDILFLYAVCGMVLYLFRDFEPAKLRVGGILLIIITFLTWVMMALSFIGMKAMAGQPGASPGAIQAYQEAIVALGAPGSWAITAEVQTYLGSYAQILAYRTAPEQLAGPLIQTLTYGVETLGLMMLGMSLYKQGLLTGAWRQRHCLATALICYAIGIPPMALLGWWCATSGFEAVTTFSAVFVWSIPFRIALTLGHAAMAIWLIGHFRQSRAIARIAAAGRAAFTNYLGTSIVMTTIFYGYGLGLFAELSRAAIYPFVFAGWAVMLIWSKPWLDRFAYGPFEWAWRSLARGSIQALRR